MTLKKKDMIETLQAQYESWHAVYDLFNGKIKNDNQMPCVHGWYRSFDGPSINDMYLTTAHPMGDESGELITVYDFKSVY